MNELQHIKNGMEVDKMDSFLIQYLRKSKLNKNYLAGYINSIFKTILNSNKKSHFCIYIRGACWSRAQKTATDLVNKVFDGINNQNFSIYLCNKYPGFDATYTKNALKTKFVNINTIYQNNSKKDHAKEILIMSDNQPIFYLVGSSNFSKNTYLTKDREVDQSDVAFIFNTKETNRIIKNLQPADLNQEFYNTWLEMIPTEENITEEEIDLSLQQYLTESINDNTSNIISAPFYGKSEIMNLDKNSLIKNFLPDN